MQKRRPHPCSPVSTKQQLKQSPGGVAWRGMRRGASRFAVSSRSTRSEVHSWCQAPLGPVLLSEDERNFQLCCLMAAISGLGRAPQQRSVSLHQKDGGVLGGQQQVAAPRTSRPRPAPNSGTWAISSASGSTLDVWAGVTGWFATLRISRPGLREGMIGRAVSKRRFRSLLAQRWAAWAALSGLAVSRIQGWHATEEHEIPGSCDSHAGDVWVPRSSA